MCEWKVQTRPYATVVVNAHVGSLTDAQVARIVDARMARQAVLTRAGEPLKLSVVLDESVLHRYKGDALVMADQLRHLVDAADRHNIELRVLPLHSGVFPFGSFTILTSPGSAKPYMACVEDQAGMNYLDRSRELDDHVRLFAHIAEAALSPRASRDLIEATAQERYP
jgi:hypothetical protein